MELDTVVPAKQGIVDDDAGLFHKTGHGKGGFETVKCADHASIVGESPATCSIPDGEELTGFSTVSYTAWQWLHD